MKTDKIIRMRLSTFKKIRRAFPSPRGETLANYFSRLATELEQQTKIYETKLEKGFYEAYGDLQ